MRARPREMDGDPAGVAARWGSAAALYFLYDEEPGPTVEYRGAEGATGVQLMPGVRQGGIATAASRVNDRKNSPPVGVDGR